MGIINTDIRLVMDDDFKEVTNLIVEVRLFRWLIKKDVKKFVKATLGQHNQ